MTDSLGTARLDIVVDLAQMHATIDRAKNITASLSAETQKTFETANASQKAATLSLLRYMETLGKSNDEVKLMRAVWRGVGTDVAKEIGGLILQQRQLAEFNLAAKKAEENDFLREQARVVSVLTQRFHELEAAEAETAAFNLAGKKQDETNFMREQQRVVAALTQRFHELEAAEAEAARGTNFLTSLHNQAAAIGKTRSELLEMQAAELGVTRQAAPLIAKLREQEVQLGRTATKFNEYGISAKQTQLALRQVPAQITDIVVSLQGGQNPLSIVLQQGGQLRDLFGGIRPAAAALGNALRGLINPYTLLAAAVAGLGLVYYKAEQQTEGLTRALITSGRQADVTSAQILGIAKSFDQLEGVNTNQAIDALTQVAANGKIASEQISLVAGSAILMQQLTGQAIEETVNQFADLAKDPLTASLRLTESMGYLTQETWLAIEAAIEQGDHTRAAQLAQEAFADSIATRTTEMRENLGLISRGFLNIKESAGEAWDEVLQGMRKVEDKAEGMLQKFFGADPKSGRGFMGLAQLTASDFMQQATFGAFSGADFTKPKDPTGAVEESKKLDAEAAQAAARWHSVIEANKSRLQKQEQEVAEIKKLGETLKLDAGTVKAQIDASWARFHEQDKKGKSTSSLDNAGMRNQLQDFKDVLAQEQAAIQNSRTVLAAEYGAKLVTVQDYYAKQKDLAAQDLASQEKALTGQIGVLRQRNATGKDAIDVDRQLGQLEAELANIRARAGVDLKVLAIQEQAVTKARREAVEDYRHAQDLATAALEAHWDAQVANVSIGSQEAAHLERVAALTRKYSEEIARLNLEKARDPANAGYWQEQIDAAKRSMDAQVKVTEDGYSRMLQAQADWRNGVKKGWAEWAEQARDVAGQIAQVTTHALDRMTEEVTNFALTGKFQFKDMLADILTELTKFFAKQAVLQFFSAFAGSFGGGGVATMGGSGQTTAGGMFGGVWSHAKGGAYNSPSLSEYSNGVYNTPQPFMFAKGAGIFGEAGWEAIMPLTKGPDGNLGVRANMASGGSMVVVNINTTINNDGTVSTSSDSNADADAAKYERFAKEMENVAQRAIQKAMMQGGALWRVGVQTP